ncbi:MAG: gluconate 2-dehydrogenase subunit 3 family protein [Chitinophagaceae bacterium]|nr:gluconate 2-dehydrogenase subunit 3 family protein [Chitinophagaceae bacterium]
MKRRDSIKALGIGALSAGALLKSCKPEPGEKTAVTNVAEGDYSDRQAQEIERDKKLLAETFFTPHEMATITILADIIIPKDERSGSASAAKVPEFIEFIVKDMPEHQLPMRGGLRWLDLKCLNRYDQPFKDCTATQQLEIVNEIAYPARAKPEMQQGVAFFNRMRNLTATGFFTSKMGIEDLGYAGNKPNRWEGVPPDIIKAYGLEDITF